MGPRWRPKVTSGTSWEEDAHTTHSLRLGSWITWSAYSRSSADWPRVFRPLACLQRRASRAGLWAPKRVSRFVFSSSSALHLQLGLTFAPPETWPHQSGQPNVWPHAPARARNSTPPAPRRDVSQLGASDKCLQRNIGHLFKTSSKYVQYSESGHFISFFSLSQQHDRPNCHLNVYKCSKILENLPSPRKLTNSSPFTAARLPLQNLDLNSQRRPLSAPNGTTRKPPMHQRCHQLLVHQLSTIGPHGQLALCHWNKYGMHNTNPPPRTIFPFDNLQTDAQLSQVAPSVLAMAAMAVAIDGLSMTNEMDDCWKLSEIVRQIYESTNRVIEVSAF